ncbi:hypothetical protein HD806DRAFT_552214 [Xylariaceae sp. AK1471]|nr:hypothetical protein HD806DRAFT_552214 [Xylariaceae sp. AK1471]
MDNNVYLGIWTNWSRGRILGPTLTLTKDDGNLLIAFVAFFIAFVSTRFWKIFCLFLHRYYSSSKPQDTVHHQRQVILRNSSSPESGLTSLFKLLFAWQPWLPARKLVLIAPPMIFAIAILAAFTIAGGFSSRISTSAGDEVLLLGTECGLTTSSGDDTSKLVTYESSAASTLNNAANYAEQCYNNTGSGTLECNKFVTKALPIATIDRNASCPFPSDICRKEDGNIRLDTGYLDSNDHFGLNAPANQRFQWRYVMHCAPIQTEGYSSLVINNGTSVRYHYGVKDLGSKDNITTVDYIYDVPSVETQYESGSGKRRDGLNFLLSGISLFEPIAQPIAALNQSAGDLIIVFLSGYGVYFSPATDDDWYRATFPSGHLTNLFVSGSEASFRPVEAASPLACVEQWQWCNSALPKGTNRSDCGPLTGQFAAAYRAAPLFNLSSADLDPYRPTSETPDGTRLIWPFLATNWNPTTILASIAHLGAKSLASQTRLNSGVQWSLPRDQWHYDVTHWFNTILAAVQASFVDTALGPASYGFGELSLPPLNAEEEKLCASQKIRSSRHSNFNLFGLLFTILTGSFIVGTSYALEPILALLHRRNGYKQYAYLEWVSNHSLQLHRLAHEDGSEKGHLDLEQSFASGQKDWSRCTKDVPITGIDVQLAPLDLTDMEHPTLRFPVTTGSSNTVTPAESNDSPPETAGTRPPVLLLPLTTGSSEAAMPDVSNGPSLDMLDEGHPVLTLLMTTEPPDTGAPSELNKNPVGTSDMETGSWLLASLAELDATNQRSETIGYNRRDSAKN